MQLIILIFTFLICSLNAESVAVSIAPYLEIVQEIAGPEIQVHLVVPQGASSHSFETTPKQLQLLRQDAIWFIIGEPFESRAIKSLQGLKEAPRIVDLRNGLKLIDEGCRCHHHDHASSDPHIWMNPEMMAVQVIHIRDALAKQYPDKKEALALRSDAVLEKLKILKNTIDQALTGKQGTLIIAHPAYSYLLRPYNLNQYALEFDGKEPSAKQLSESIDIIKAAHTKTIFTQKQYSTRAADRIAKILDLRLEELDPYSSEYFASMNQIAEEFGKELAIEPCH